MGTTQAAQNFGVEVRRRREAQGLTLVMLAERSGLTPNYIGTIENGLRDPSLSTVLALANGLGVGAEQLFGGSGEVRPATFDAAQLFEIAPPDVQAAIMELLYSVLGRPSKKSR